MDKIVIDNLSVRYSDGLESLRHVNLGIPENAITVLFGPAGGGKSTLLRVLNRLNDLSDVDHLEGRVIFNGQNILDPRTNDGLRRKIGIVFFALFRCRSAFMRMSATARKWPASGGNLA